MITALARLYTDSHLFWLANHAEASVGWQALEQVTFSFAACEGGPPSHALKKKMTC